MGEGEVAGEYAGWVLCGGERDVGEEMRTVWG